MRRNVGNGTDSFTLIRQTDGMNNRVGPDGTGEGMVDENYVLDLYIVDGTRLTLPDTDAGNETISVQGLYDEVVQIKLCYQAETRLSASAGATYVDALGNWHEMVIFGVIENATGSAGRDLIHGNDLANRLWGETVLAGPGAADTLLGGAGNDTVHGGVGADLLAGEGEDDLLYGEVGADTITGGAGRDTVEGGAGADSLTGGGEAGDMLSYLASDAGVEIALLAGVTVTGRGGDAAGDQVQGFTAITGSAFRDLLSDNDKATLADGANDNLFSGGGGRDRLRLGGGNDTGLGGASADVIWGEAGQDVLSGDFGNDILRGGLGQDTLSGGAGADRFEFRLLGDSAPDMAAQDIITDFAASEGDRIDLRGIDAMAGVIGNQAFVLISTDFTGTAGEMRLAAQGSDLMVMADTTGDGLADFALLLTDVAGLSDSDFLL